MTEVQKKEHESWFRQLSPALIGLLGVLIGAAASSGAAYLVDHSHARANEAGAERVVLAEVLRNDALFRRAARSGRMTDAAWRQVSDASWRDDREGLGQSLSNREWAWVMRYYNDLAAAKNNRAAHGDETSRLIADADCALVALNVGKYLTGFTLTLPESTCTQLPGAP